MTIELNISSLSIETNIGISNNIESTVKYWNSFNNFSNYYNEELPFISYASEPYGLSSNSDISVVEKTSISQPYSGSFFGSIYPNQGNNTYVDFNNQIVQSVSFQNKFTESINETINITTDISVVGSPEPTHLTKYTYFLRVCFNTKSDCILIQTPSTKSDFYINSCTDSKGNKYCQYNIGNLNGRCVNINNLSMPKPSGYATSILNACHSSPNKFNNGNRSYSYFSGSLASANGTINDICKVNDGSITSIPTLNGLFGTCSIKLSSLCCDLSHFNGDPNTLVYGQTKSGESVTSTIGLSSPQMYLALTWKEETNGCFPNYNKPYW